MAAFDIGKEEASLNQYWYSPQTIDKLVEEIQLHATSCAFLSCPSLFFALSNTTLRSNSKLFEFDKQWETDPNFVFYDFNQPGKVPVQLFDAFDYVVVDPPFITRDVWSKYAETVKLILKKEGKMLFTSVIENHQMLEELVDTPLMVPKFRPSIPHLVYQYHCFTNYPATHLEIDNPELPPEDASAVAARAMANDMRESQNAFKAQMHARNRDAEKKVKIYDVPEGVMKWTHVPQGLTEYADGASAPPAAQEVPVEAYGPEYASIYTRRQLCDDFKKQIDLMTRRFDAMLRAKNAKDDALFQRLDAERLEQIAAMSDIVAKIAEMSPTVDGAATCPVMRSCLKDFAEVEIVKSKLQELSADATRKYKSPIFNRMREMLAEMKAIKQKWEKEHEQGKKNAALQ